MTPETSLDYHSTGREGSNCTAAVQPGKCGVGGGVACSCW